MATVVMPIEGQVNAEGETEYETLGIVTLEDVIEELLGEEVICILPLDS